MNLIDIFEIVFSIAKLAITKMIDALSWAFHSESFFSGVVMVIGFVIFYVAVMNTTEGKRWEKIGQEIEKNKEDERRSAELKAKLLRGGQ